MRIGRHTVHPLLLYAVLAVAAFLAGVFIFNSIILPGLVGRRDIAIVPDLAGLSEKIAEDRCGEVGLNLVVVGNRFSDDVPEGYVIDQDPTPDERLKGGRAIRVILSSGHRMEVVPDLIDKSLRQAELLIESAGLRRGRVVRVFDHARGQNLVISTSPAPGTEVPRSSPVDILLAMRGEPREYIMPDLVGMDLPFAKARLERMGFEISRVVSKRDETRFPNTILSHDPPAGSLIKEGGAIELVISTVE
jgi:beta-lactam-binding protein with PASTA domain